MKREGTRQKRGDVPFGVTSRARKLSRLGRLSLAVCLSGSLLCLPLLAKNGAFSSTAHGDRVKGPQRRADLARGTCGQCHDASRSDGTRPVRSDDGLFAPNDNDLCFTCHGLQSESGVFPGGGTWMRSAHALSPQMVRGGSDPRPSTDAGKCVNCHNPHGVKDNSGLIPAMLEAREPDLCLACHDGSRGPDIRSQLSKSYRHGMDARGHHDPHEGSDPLRYAAMPGTNRHVSCSDCHNVHRATADRGRTVAPDASSVLTGVARVEVTNGSAGTAPRFSWRGADDPGIAKEYEICFKCHSSWTRLGQGQDDLALLTNPQNASFHPIQAAGRNPNVDPQAFVNGVSADSRLTCTDCHAGDDPDVAGPHGSSYRYLLKRPATTVSTTHAMQRDDLCFACHTYDVYASITADAGLLRASRFNGPATSGHTFHIALQQIPCYACHETHGSARTAALISRNRTPGITTFTQSTTGGMCTSTCHSPKTYTLNYPR